MKPAPSVLLVDDDAAFRQVLVSELGRAGFAMSAAASGEEAVRTVRDLRPDVVLLDYQLPGMNGIEVLKALREGGSSAEVILLTGHGSIDTAIDAIRIGAFDYVVKPCPLEELQIRIQRALERQALQQRTSLLERGLTPSDPGSSFVGDSPQFRDLMSLVQRVAPAESTVLIAGETGTGKEVVAKLIHARSARRFRPFVVVECAALQENLLESELFGHERGAFTGAERAKPGLFEVANGGTIFLDEIGEVSQATQVKLLRVLDTSTFRHVGGTAEIKVDVRVLAATNRDLPGMVRQGLFREDLYYRLSTIALAVPPLRERAGDIDVLTAHFVRLLNERFGFVKRVGPDALALFQRHLWPGNVRELLHVIEAALILCDGPEILPAHLPAAMRAVLAAQGPVAVAGAPATIGGRVPTLEELERAHIDAVLTSLSGHRGNAAKALGISERNLYRKLKDYGLA